MPLGMIERYRRIEDLPETLPAFPLRGVILLPRATLTLNVFEPRYLAMTDFALGGERLIGVVQPAREAGEDESPPGRNVVLRKIGCAGRIIAFNEGGDGRYLITLAGVARFELVRECSTEYPFRRLDIDFRNFAADLAWGRGEEEVDRVHLLATLKEYLRANNLTADWDRILGASNERLVNTLSVLSPYGPEEKQALLEAPSLKTRAEALVALAEMELATRNDDTGTSLQ